MLSADKLRSQIALILALRGLGISRDLPYSLGRRIQFVPDKHHRSLGETDVLRRASAVLAFSVLGEAKNHVTA
jgi:hypothetical protein